MWIDLTAYFTGGLHQQTGQFSQSDAADDYKINIAVGLFLLASKRSEYESYPDVFFVAQSVFYDVHQPACLENKGTDFNIKRMRGVCFVVDTITISHPGDDIEALELFSSVCTVPMAKPVLRSISRIWRAASGTTPKRMRKIPALIFDDKSSANILIAYAYTIQLHGFAIHLLGLA